MAHTHEFDCIVCGAHFDSQDALVRHNEQHMRNATGMERPRDDSDGRDEPDRRNDRDGADLGRS